MYVVSLCAHIDVPVLWIDYISLSLSMCRKAWKEYFEVEGSIKVAFWSALAQNGQGNESHSDSALESATEEGEATLLSQAAVPCDTNMDTTKSMAIDKRDGPCLSDAANQKPDLPTVVAPPLDHTPNKVATCSAECAASPSSVEGVRLLSRDELIQQLLSISPVPQGQLTTVGMVRM